MNVSHTVSTNTGLSNLNTTFIADNTLILDFLVLTTVALPVFTWSKYSFAEQTISFWLQCSVVNSLWLGNLTM